MLVAPAGPLMSKKKSDPKKVRADFKKNRESKSRRGNLTRAFKQADWDEDKEASRERISGKGELSRKRTVMADQDDDQLRLAVDESACQTGRVINAGGLHSIVQTEQGKIYRCATRRLLKTMSTDQRHVVATGDHVLVRIAGEHEGIIERVEPRHGVISRTSRGRQHVIVSNVDQMLIVTSAAEPVIKPHLIDRMLVTADKSDIEPVVLINKIDLVDASQLQTLAGEYGQLGYRVLFLSAATGQGISLLRDQIRNRQSVVAGQSGVGKSSLLNAIQPSLGLQVREVSADNKKGKHTTTAASLIALDMGGWIVDTPGIRQFQLWDVIPEEVAGFYRDIRPFVSWCKFPDCTHIHEGECAVKDAVADGLIGLRRYDSYCQMVAED